LSEIEIEIDGRLVKAQPNSTVIQVADEAGIYIPRFCYHKHLSIAANCRMCLVEMEKSPKPVPACATPVMPGMKIFTRSPKAIAAQKAVMEFLLINHPLDCPICDQGGECELQDLSMGYGAADSYFTFGKRSVADQDIGPLIETEMTRCIQCTRCVRFGDEVAGLRELGAVGRGEHMEITTYVSHAIQSEVSGNIIDLCPVGALTSKPFRFSARAWELNQYPSIAAHDCLGTHINVHTRNGQVMRVVPRENTEINETWIADRERFSYLGLAHADRLAKPQIRLHGQWQETDWQTALEYTVQRLQQVIATQGSEQIGILASPNSTTEEFFLLQKLLRQLGGSHIDHRLRQVDFTDQDNFPLFPGIEGSIADLENYHSILLVGSNLQKEQPLAALRVRKATLKGATVYAVNMLDYAFHFKLKDKKIAAPQDFVWALAGIAKALLPQQAELADVQVTEQDRSIAEKLRTDEKSCILLGAVAFNHPQASLIRWLARLIAKATQSKLGLLTEGSNTAGAWLAGVLPHRTAAGESLQQAGLNAQAMLQQARQSYLLLNIEPELDCANPVAAVQALAQAKFVVSLSTFKNPVLEQYVHVILPIAAFTETAGTFVNVTGEWQSFKGVANPYGEARPAWKVLRVLGNLLHLPGFDYTSSEEVLRDLQLLLKQKPVYNHNNHPQDFTIKKDKAQLMRIAEVPLYSTDALVRRAAALQETQSMIEGELAVVRVNTQTAAELQINPGAIVRVKQQGSYVQLPVVIDERVPVKGASIATGIPSAANLSELFGAIEVELT
jgi:NADH-quinone oxidoreductase subunit G